MTGNDQKSVWEHHLGVGTAVFVDLGRPGRSSGVIEGYFEVDSQNSKVSQKTFRKATKYITKLLEMIRKVCGSIIWVLERCFSVRVALDVYAHPFRGPQRRTPCLEAALP